MIVSKLAGGLGNQMFQYAIARNLAKNNFPAKIHLDTLFLENSAQSDIFTKREYELSEFNICADTINVESTKNFLESKLTLVDKLLSRKYIHAKEKDLAFDASILSLRGNIYLDGHWATEKYFIGIKNHLLKDFTLRNKGSDKYINYQNMIKEARAVSIHVRRGDYVTNKQANKFHGICDIDYYQRAMSYVSERCKQPVFYVFSDDIAWCKDNFIGNNFIIVEGTSAHEDIMLMKNCLHNIIANSTFSWWGAWLNSNVDKIIIAPNNWFRESEIKTKDLLPEDWIKL